MGYNIQYLHADIFIDAKDIDSVYKAVTNLANETHRGSGFVAQGGKIKSKHFAFVDTDGLRQSKTLEEALEQWNWKVGFDDEGNLRELYFLDTQKLGDEAILFETIAPWVTDGSFILLAGEEGAISRWYFKDGVCKTQWATLVFEDV